MNRSKKLVRNLIIIAMFLSVFFYFNGFYFSKQKCVTETLRGLYSTETSKEVMELRYGNCIATVMAEENDESFSIIETNKKAFFYRTGDCSTGIKIDKEKSMTISGIGSEEQIAVFIYRNDKSIDRVEVVTENGETYTIAEWHEDYAGYVRENHNWESATYKAYNAEGELVGEEIYY